jgi:hypothetical protein
MIESANENDAWYHEQERLSKLPRVLIPGMRDAFILVEAPTGICFLHAPELNDGPALMREGFLLPVTVESKGDRPVSVADALAEVSYFQDLEDLHPEFEDRELDPIENVSRCIPVRTIYGPGWLIWMDEWENLGSRR